MLAGARRKLIAAGVSAAAVLIVLLLFFLRSGPPEDEVDKNFCGSGTANSNQFVKEYVIPTPCSKPLGITVDGSGRVWFAETGVGKIARFSPEEGSYEEFKIPLPDALVTDIWGMSFGKTGKLWFTDLKNNAVWMFDPATNGFEMYLIPTKNSFPAQIYIDDRQTVWFTEAWGNRLGKIIPSLAKHRSSQGVEELTPEGRLELFGGVTGDAEGNLWFTMLTYPVVGKIGSYNPSSNLFHTYSLPQQIKSPVGIALDSSGKVWVSDHGTSLFARFDPASNSTVVYVTSPTVTHFPTSLPYWNYPDRNGRIWFNEHQGNRIAYFDPSTGQLVEYDIPTVNSFWGGVSNTLQMAVAPDGKVWFTEWTENKLGVVDPSVPLPFDIRLQPQSLKLRQGGTTILNLTITHRDTSVRAVPKAAGTFTMTGELQNITATFRSIPTQTGELGLSYALQLSASPSLKEGEYTLMVGASYGGVTRMIPVSLEVSSEKQ